MSDLEFIKNTPSDELYKKHLKVVFNTYLKLFGEVCTGCPTKIAGYIKRIKNHKISDIMSEEKKSKSKFRLKEGSQIVVAGKSKSYSNANLTDEAALAFLRKNPNRRVLFAVVPKNLDELLAGNDEAPEATHVKVNDKDYTVEEGVNILAQIGVNTAAKTVDGVQKRFDGLKEDEKKKLDELLAVANTLTNDGPDAPEAPEATPVKPVGEIEVTTTGEGEQNSSEEKE